MDDFNEILGRAVQGDSSSVEYVIRRYQPLINKNSIWKGKLDEDLRQHIEMQIFRKISKFNLYEDNPK